MRAQPIRPFHQHNAVRARLIETELDGLLRLLQAIKIEMPDRTLICFISLHQCKSRARHFFTHTERAKEAACEGGLAAAETALQKDEVPKTRQPRDARGQLIGCGEIGQHEGWEDGRV